MRCWCFNVKEVEGMSVEKAQNVSVRIVNPVAKVESKTITPAAALTSLAGKKIALWWNGKAKGDIALKTIAARLKKEYNVESELFTQGWPHGDDVYDKVIAAGCEAAIATTGD